jgi:O-methyltransferase domain/Dimerisation domain/Domain of unknown function (DUF4937
LILKYIEVYVKPGQMAEYLHSQDVWNRETRKALGHLGMFCGTSASDENVVHLLFFWRSREDYDRWMAVEHDRIAQETQADLYYDRIVVKLLEPVFPEPTLLPVGFSPEETFEAADVQLWSEAYRTTLVLRTAVRLGLFDRLSTGPKSVNDLAAELNVDPEMVNRLCRALASMQLVEPSGANWANSGVAARTLVRSSPAYQGDMVLYNSSPQLVQYWSQLGERFGLSADIPNDEPNFNHEQFLLAMANTAAGGQSEALIRAVNLSQCHTLLDIGGGAGHYAIALCRMYSQLRAIVLDLPQSESLAKKFVREAGLEGRVEFVAGDYRAGAFPGPVDALLLSNVLRGETRGMIDDILNRSYAALEPGGLAIVSDLFPETPPAPLGIRGGLFLLHSRFGANLSLEDMSDAIGRAGFFVERSERLPRWVVMNGIIVARRPPA